MINDNRLQEIISLLSNFFVLQRGTKSKKNWFVCGALRNTKTMMESVGGGGEIKTNMIPSDIDLILEGDSYKLE